MRLFFVFGYAVSWLYTGALVFFAVLAARDRTTEPLRRALLWLALLQLASFRSPFTPDTYALFPILWMPALLLADGDCGAIAPAIPA